MEVEVLVDLTAEPVSLELAAAFCKVDDVALEGELLGLLLTSAREWCEEYTGLSFGPKTFRAKVPQSQWRGPDTLPYGPNITITDVLNANGESIGADFFGSTWFAEYLKGMSVNNTVKEDYHGWGFGYTERLYQDMEYTLTYTGGYAEGKLPAPIKEAILKTVLESYNNRENTVIGTIVATLPHSAKAILDQYKPKVLF